MLVFICYRRADSRAITGRIYDHLATALGPVHVYMDVNIPDGAVFGAHLDTALRSCTLGLAIIGPHWSTPRPDGSPDVVHQELQILCQRRVPIIPVLVDGASLPLRSSLPPSIAGLLAREAALMDSGRDFPYRFQQLLQTIHIVTGKRTGEHRVYSTTPPQGSAPPHEPRRSRGDAASFTPYTVTPSRRPKRGRALWLGASLAALGTVITVAVVSAFAEPDQLKVEAPAAEPPRSAETAPVARSKACTSPWSSRCAGSACSGLIRGSEQFGLHLAGIFLDETVDPCAERPVRDLWLCRGEGCLSQREACTRSHTEARAYTAGAFNVTGAQLDRGFELTVREGGADGPILASLKPAYADALLKQPFLCSGGAYGRKSLGPAPGPIVKLTYYLEPR